MNRRVNTFLSELINTDKLLNEEEDKNKKIKKVIRVVYLLIGVIRQTI